MGKRPVTRPAQRCECGGHGWVILTRGHIALFDPNFVEAFAAYNWFAKSDGRNVYAARTVRWITIRMHRMILPVPAGFVVDHISGNTTDNRSDNLRICKSGENSRNRKPITGGTSRYRGVSRWQNQWKATIGSDGRQYYIGRFDREIDAALAYDEEARRLHGPFARLNFPDQDSEVA